MMSDYDGWGRQRCKITYVHGQKDTTTIGWKTIALPENIAVYIWEVWQFILTRSQSNGMAGNLTLEASASLCDRSMCTRWSEAEQSYPLLMQMSTNVMHKIWREISSTLNKNKVGWSYSRLVIWSQVRVESMATRQCCHCYSQRGYTLA